MRCDHSLLFECYDHLVRMCRWIGGQDGENLWDKLMRRGKRIVIRSLYVPIRHHWTMELCYRQSSAGWLMMKQWDFIVSNSLKKALTYLWAQFCVKAKQYKLCASFITKQKFFVLKVLVRVLCWALQSSIKPFSSPTIPWSPLYLLSTVSPRKSKAHGVWTNL